MSHLGLLLALFWAAPVERIVRIDVPSHEAVYPLLRKTGLAVIDAQDRFVTAYADDEMISRVQALGYKVTVLVEDYQQQATVELQAYHTYPQVCSIMNGLALVHPEICRLETLGFSAGNRPIPALKVTESPGIESGRPVIRLIGAHHGNEKISTEITLAFMQLLGDSYPTNQQVRALVDTREFWIIPILNPDGHVANRRTNDALVDLNRDYGYEWEVYSSPFTQPETRALLYHAELHPPTLEFAYHSSASYCNYLWDNTPVDPPDSAWIIALSRRYCDSTYGSSLTRLTPINGWDWYEVHGSCQDYTFGACGGLAWTIETRQPSTRAGIDSICLANRRALLDMATIAGWGISGHVYDSLTGAPLFARVEFTAPWRWNCYTNRATGVFHKILAPGAYNIRVRANGYNPKSFTGVVVPETGAAVLDVALTRPDTEPVNYVQKVAAVR
ncbi:MAG: M14 family zinc carboxypeptidase, partial [candidate division WOR-3 bacterium]